MTEQHVSVSAVGRHFDEEVEIAAIARRYYEEAGCPDGHDQEYWFRAEREFHEKHMAPPAARRAPAPSPKDNQFREEMRLGK